MKILEIFNRTFGFTRNESYVVMFLVFSFIVGIGIKMFKSSVVSEQKYDYRVSDVEFEKRSQLLISDSNASNQEQNVQSSDEIKSKNSKVLKSNLQIKSININTATREELITLPGIGESTAERILQYRKGNGPFQSLDELLNIKGIGKKKLEHIKPFCKLQ